MISISWALSWLLTNWRVALAVLAVVGAGLLVLKVENDAYRRGEAACAAQAAAADRERTDAANRADDDARRCLLDPDCRLRDDGFRRD